MGTLVTARARRSAVALELRSRFYDPAPRCLRCSYGRRMVWLVLLLLVVTAAVLYARSVSTKGGPSARTPSAGQPQPPPSLAAGEARLRRALDIETARIRSEVEAEAAQIEAEVRHAAEADLEVDPLQEADVPQRVIWREDYAPKDDEDRYLTRRVDGTPHLRLADAGDRFAIWSPVDGGALINPKGPGIRRLGLYASQARGADHYRSAYRAADLRRGRWIDLVREPDNPHDPNAVAMCAPGSRVAFAYVQRGRAPAVAKRMDAGEQMAAVSMRGPGRGHDDESTFVLIGSRTDLEAMLRA